MSNNIQNMQIFTIIGQIEDMVENSPRPKIGGANKRVIDVEEMMDLLGDLKVTIPEDIRRANSVIVDAQSMIDNADEHARDVVSQAETDGEKIVADAQQKAEANAGLVFENAKCYADDVLKDLENFLNEYRQLVAINRKDLDARNTANANNQPSAEPAAENENGNANAAEEETVAEEPKKHTHTAKMKSKPIDDEEEDEYEDEEDDEEEKGGFFGKLFGKKKKNIDFDDDDFDDEE